MNPITRLSLGQEAVVCDLQCSGRQRQHLEDLGFVPGTLVRPLFHNPSKSLTAYAVMGSVIALRHCDALRILCKPKGGNAR